MLKRNSELTREALGAQICSGGHRAVLAGQLWLTNLLLGACSCRQDRPGTSQDQAELL